jgi:hypothetical protein
MSYQPAADAVKVPLISPRDGDVKSSITVVPPTRSRCGPSERIQNV